MSKALISILLCSNMFLWHCELNKTTLSSEHPPTLTISDLRSIINLRFAYYDSLVIENQDMAVLNQKSLSRIDFGEKDIGNFDILHSVTPEYKALVEEYTLNFSISHTITSSHLKAYFFTLRFLMEDNTYFDLDTFVLPYKFPYPSTEIFLDTRRYLDQRVQGFVILEDKIYWYNLGATVLREFNLNTFENIVLLGLGSGDHVAGIGNYLFLDIAHCWIQRYNIKAGTLEVEFPLPWSDCKDLRGLSADNEMVYGMFKGDNAQESILLVYDTTGVLLEEKILPFQGFYMSVYDGILYTYDWGNRHLIRYQLQSSTLLPERLYPAEDVDGFFVKEDKLYFTDYYREMISLMSLSDLDSNFIQNSQYGCQSMFELKLINDHSQELMDINP